MSVKKFPMGDVVYLLRSDKIVTGDGQRLIDRLRAHLDMGSRGLAKQLVEGQEVLRRFQHGKDLKVSMGSAYPFVVMRPLELLPDATATGGLRAFVDSRLSEPGLIDGVIVTSDLGYSNTRWSVAMFGEEDGSKVINRGDGQVVVYADTLDRAADMLFELHASHCKLEGTNLTYVN